MSQLELDVDGTVYMADLLEAEASDGVTALCGLLPLESEHLHVCWSGYAILVHIDDHKLTELPRENHTVYPSGGDIFLYLGYRIDQDTLVPMGCVSRIQRRR